MARVRLGAASQLPEGRGVAVRAGDRRIAVFRLGSTVFALDDSCPHRAFPLHDGVLDGATVRCRVHGSCFDLASGAVLRGPARRAVRSYLAVITGDEIEIETED